MKAPRKFRFVTFIMLSLIMGCTKKTDTQEIATTDVVADTTIGAVDVQESLSEEEAQNSPTIEIIDLGNTEQNITYENLKIFPPLTQVMQWASRIERMQDSLNEIHQYNPWKDSTAYMQLSAEAFRSITDYEKQMMSARDIKQNFQSLLSLNRVAGPEDRSLEKLTSPNGKGSLTNATWYFIGGAPFLTQSLGDEGGAYRSNKGVSEKRYYLTVPENAQFILNAIYNFQTPRTTLNREGPLDASYEGPSRSIKQVGALEHVFADRVPVILLTTTGAVKGEIVAVRMKLFEQSMGCIINHPLITIAGPPSTDENSILGVLMTSSAPSITNVKSNVNDNTWTVDIDGDGIPDLAGVRGTFEGISSDAMNEAIWYVNDNGTWKIADWASEPDCT